MNTTFLITGATGCLGQAIALEAAQSKTRLILHGRNSEALQALDDKIQSQAPTETVLWPLDFVNCTELSVATAIQELSHHVHAIDSVFHCALASGEQVPILHEAHDTWQNVIQTNVAVPRLIIKHIMPLLEKAQAARIVFFDDQDNQTLYQGSLTMSKSMINHLVTQLNAEFENTNQISSVILKLKPLYSPLRAKRFPGENPDNNTQAETIAKDILLQL